MNHLIRDKSKEIVKLQDVIKKDDLNYKSKRGKTLNFAKYSLPIPFLRDIYKGDSSIEKADNKESNFTNELKNFEKDTKTFEEQSFLNNLVFLLSVREKVLNSFKGRLFPIKKLDKILTSEPTPKPATDPKVAKEPAKEPEVATEPTKATKATKAKAKRKVS